MERLNLSNNRIEKIENLDALANLTELLINHNRMYGFFLSALLILMQRRKKLAGLGTQLVNVQTLGLSENFITDIDELRCLSSLPRLSSLELRGNPICAIRFVLHPFSPFTLPLTLLLFVYFLALCVLYVQ